MLHQDQIENASTEDIQELLEFFQRDIRHAKSWLQELKHAESVLTTALCAMEDGGKL